MTKSKYRNQETLSPVAVLRLPDGTSRAYTVIDVEGKDSIACDACSRTFVVGPGRNTTNFESHRRQKHPGLPLPPTDTQNATNSADAQPSNAFQPSNFAPAIEDPATPVPHAHPLSPLPPSSPPSDYIPILIDDEVARELTDSLSNLSLHDPVQPAPPETYSGPLCEGCRVEWTPGSVWLTYGFSRHASGTLDWEPIGFGADGLSLHLRARGCLRIVTTPHEIFYRCCATCAAVPNLRSFIDFMSNAGKEEVPYRRLQDLTSAQLITVIRRKTQNERRLHTKLWNERRKNHRLRNKLDTHKRILMLLSTRDVAGLRRIMNTAIRRRVSPQGVLTLLRRAIDGNYRARSGFTQRDFDKAFVAKSFGGVRTLEVLHTAEGYPAPSTVDKHRPTPQLLPCLSIPTAAEITANMNALLDPAVRRPPAPLPSGRLVGIIIMIDGVALDEVCRYDSVRNVVLGFCREHSWGLKLYIDSIEAIEQLADALERGRCHHGKDGTVLAIAPVTDREHYTPIPLILSPSCKTETGNVLKIWLRTFIDVWKTHPFGEALYGPIRALASDGESSFRLARFELCMDHSIKAESDLGRLVCSLPGLNCQTGPHEILGTCDPKHIFKRFATLLRSLSGILVRDTVISTGDIKTSLLAIDGMTEKQADDMLDPADKQNVPKAVGLIQNLLFLCGDVPFPSQHLPPPSSVPSQESSQSLPPLSQQSTPPSQSAPSQSVPSQSAPSQPPPSQTAATPPRPHVTQPSHPAETKRRRSIEFLAQTLGYFVRPFIDVKMDLKDQLRSLSTYVHLAAAMYLKGRLSFLTSALFADSQAIVKNIFITVAKLFLVDPDLPYYIILEGTDRLEGIFSNVRTQDHNRNFDTLQLAQKLSIAAEIVATLLRNPDLARRHRRLDLAGAIGIDHINPASCLGDYRVGSVDLRKEWCAGALEANRLLALFLGSSERVDFDHLFAQPHTDVMRPLGKGYVGTSFDHDDLSVIDASVEATISAFAADGPEDEDVEESDNEVDSPDQPVPGMESLEDYLELQAQLEEERQPFDRFLEITDAATSSTKKYLKSSLIRVMLAGEKVRRKVAMRTLRARGMTIDDFRKSWSNDWSEDRTEEDMMKAGDPAAVLVRIGNNPIKVCLAVVEVVGFSIPGMRALAPQAPLDTLEEKGSKCPTVVAQILQILPDSDDRGVNDCLTGWKWSGDYVRFASDSVDPSVSTQKQFQFRVPGYLVHPLVAEPVPAGSDSSGLTVTWRFLHTDLTDAAEFAWTMLNPDTEEIMANFNSLPALPPSTITLSSLPYRDPSIGEQFVIDKLPSHLTVIKKNGDDVVPCKLCSHETKLSQMRQHVGRHILFALRKWDDPRAMHSTIGSNPCGWCGRSDTCRVQLVAGKTTPKIESDCEYHYTSMRYSAAAKSTPSSPCSNIPIHCPTCKPSLSGERRTFWKYNAIHHLLAEHSFDEEDRVCISKVPLEFMVSTFVTSSEESAMGIEEFATARYREVYEIPDSDAVEEAREALLKRGRSVSDVNPVEPAKQKPRLV